MSKQTDSDPFEDSLGGACRGPMGEDGQKFVERSKGEGGPISAISGGVRHPADAELTQYHHGVAAVAPHLTPPLEGAGSTTATACYNRTLR